MEGHLLKKIKKIISNSFKGRYGIDSLGKTISISSIVIYLIGNLLQNTILISLTMMGIIIALYRILSKQQWDRSEENRRYQRYIKLWKLRYESRKDSRIFMCRSCGRYIRVPKGKGKIQVTCTVCGDKVIRRT